MSISWIIIVAVFCAMGIAELVAPARKTDHLKGRISLNFGFGAIGMLVQFLIPLGAIAGAALAQASDFGLAAMLGLSPIVVAIILLLARSFVAYWVHRAHHSIPLLWRFHSLHHSDRALDLSTSFRNHPGELVIALCGSALAGFAIGAAPQTALIMETMLFIATLVSHANIKLPAGLDNALRAVLVTPAVHSVHHERSRLRADSNFGNLLTVWDRLFGTYQQSSSDLELGIAATYSTNILTELARPLRPTKNGEINPPE